VNALLAIVAPAVAWTAYLPVGAKYALVLAALPLSGLALRAQVRETRPALDGSGLLPTTVLLALLAVSSAWSAATWADIGRYLWLYGMLLLVPLLSNALPAASAKAALAHFVAASTAVAALHLARGLGVLPDSVLWWSTVDATGNQRIGNSLLLAIGAVIGLWQARHAVALRPRAGWLACTMTIVAGLALQDRRSGMVVLPIVVLAWLLTELRMPRQRVLAVIAVLGIALAAGWSVDPVRARFEEGWRELHSAVPAERVDTSWGQRLLMVRMTAAMVQERPLTGHGVASWRLVWQQRAPAGSPLADNTTPHSEYLLIAHQLGWPGLALWLWLLVAMVMAAARRGSAGAPALVVWITIATAGLFNAVLRDAKFSLVLLMLAAVAAASSRPRRSDADGGRRRGLTPPASQAGERAAGRPRPGRHRHRCPRHAGTSTPRRG